MEELPLTRQALIQLGKLFTKSLKDRIAAKIYPYGNPQRGSGNKIASGDLYDSLNFRVEEQNNVPYLVISYQDYFKYVNFGRKKNVKRVPLQVLFDWIKIKRIRGRDKKGRFIKDLSLAWAIQTNIYKYGIRPTYIYDKALDNLEDLFDNPPPQLQQGLNNLYEQIGQDINNFIERTITEEINK